MNYENDWAFDVPLAKFLTGHRIPMPTGDDGDRWRTTGLRFRDEENNVSFGMNLATGEPKTINKIVGQDTYTNPEADQYRLGAFYLGIGEFRIGFDSERVRHTVQNEIVHSTIKCPWFSVLNDNINPYIMFQTSNPYTTW